MTDLNKMINILTELKQEFNVTHSEPRDYYGKMIPGATTIEMISDNEHKVHFYFDLDSAGGKMRGVRPTVF